jgi:hypothetical protein
MLKKREWYDRNSIPWRGHGTTHARKCTSIGLLYTFMEYEVSTFVNSIVLFFLPFLSWQCCCVVYYGQICSLSEIKFSCAYHIN